MVQAAPNPNRDQTKAYFRKENSILCIIADMNAKTLSLSVNNDIFQSGFININTKIKYKLAVCIEDEAIVELQASTHYDLL